MCPMAWSWTLTYWYPSTPNPISSLSWNASLSMSFTNSRMLLLTMSAANLKWHINLYYNPVSLLVSSFDNLTQPPPPLLPFHLLWHLLTLWSVYIYSWWKPQCSWKLFIFSPGYLRYCDVYRCESGRCCTLPFFLTFLIILPFQVFLLY